MKRTVLHCCFLAMLVAGIVACRASQADGPAPRIGAPFFYDPAAGRTILMSGFSCDMSWSYETMHYSDVWTFNAQEESWAFLGEADISRATTFGYDAESARLVFVTMKPMETWAYDPASGELENMAADDMPPEVDFRLYLFGAPMAYDSESDRLILYGGAESPGKTFDGTWAYDYNSNTWTNMRPESGPPPRAFHQLVYDSESDRVVLWGGYPNLENDTRVWSYDHNSNTWEAHENNGGPGDHYERFGMIYHPPSDRIFLHSGFQEEYGERKETFLDPATWTYDLNSNTWLQIQTETDPGRRMWYSMAYDEAADKVIFFGGEKTAKYAGDMTNAVWLFDFKTMQWRDATGKESGCPS
jgi:hypothetical protein